jgi:hypothetical protein
LTAGAWFSCSGLSGLCFNKPRSVNPPDTIIAELTPETLDYIETSIRLLPQLENVVFFSAGGTKQYEFAEFDEKSFKSFAKHRDAWLDVAFETPTGKDASGEILLSRRVESRDTKLHGVLMAVNRTDR